MITSPAQPADPMLLEPQPGLLRPEADQFYWAVLSASDLQTDASVLAVLVRHGSPLLSDGLAKRIVQSPGDLQAAFMLHQEPGEEPVVIACAMSCERLDAIVSDRALVLAPAGWPRPIADRFPSLPSPPPATLNLLTGPRTPRPLLRARRKLSVALGLSVVVLSGLLVLGLERRARFADGLASAATAELDRLRTRMTGSADPILARQRHAAELARLRLAASPPEPPDSPDASSTLSDLLARWPAQDGASAQFVRVQSIQITPASIVMTMLKSPEADQERILAPLAGLPGWHLQPAQRSVPEAGQPGRSEPAPVRLGLRFAPRRGATP